MFLFYFVKEYTTSKYLLTGAFDKTYLNNIGKTRNKKQIQLSKIHLTN